MSAPTIRGKLPLLACLAALGPLSTDLYVPALPRLARAFDATPAATQFTLSAFLAAFALAQLGCGSLADRFGRRPVLLAGLSLYTFASVGCALADSLETLVFWRVLEGIGACSGPVLARALVRDTEPPERIARALAVVGLAMALAPALGPSVGGVLVSAAGWRACFFALAIAGAALLAFCSARVPETRPENRERTSGRAIVLLRDRRFLTHVALAASAYGGIFAFVAGASEVLSREFALSPEALGTCFTIPVAGYMAGNLAAQRLSTRLPAATLLVSGTTLSLVGAVLLAALAHVEHVAAVVLPQVVFMLGAGLTLPAAYAGALAPWPQHAGRASAWLGFAQMSFAALATAGVGSAANGTRWPLVLAMLACAALGTIARIAQRSPAPQPAIPVRSA